MEQKEEVKKLRLLWLLLIGIGLVLVAGSFIWLQHDSNTSVDNFQTCKDAGGVIAESYPEQCFIDGKSFVNDAQTVDADGSDYIGLTEQAAFDQAERENKPHRVVERDGESLPVTMDYVTGRLNFYVRDGVVYRVDVEGELR